LCGFSKEAVTNHQPTDNPTGILVLAMVFGGTSGEIVANYVNLVLYLLREVLE
jgi:hypothetical protein